MRACAPLAVLAAVLAAPAAASDLSFPEAVTRLHAANESLLAAGEAVDARTEERKAAFSLRFPRLDANARWTRLDDPLVMDLTPIRDVILTLHPNVPSHLVPPFVETLQNRTFWLADVTLSWPVYTGGKIEAANRAAAARVGDAARERDATEQQLTSELVERYFGLRLALRSRDLRRQVVAALDTHVAQARRLEEEGMIARAERLHAEVARAEADRELKRAEHDVALARTALANTLAVDDADVDPSSPLFVLAGVEPLDDFVARALAGNPLLGRVAAQKELAEQGRKAEEAGFLPDVYLFGKRELRTADLTILDPRWAVGAGARVTLFDGFERTHRVAAARDRERQVALTDAKARRDVRTLVEKRYRELARAREQFDALDATRALAEENLRVRERAFAEGFATSLEVVDARLALARVGLERLAAAYDFDVALAGLLSACGEGSSFDRYRARADVEVER